MQTGCKLHLLFIVIVHDCQSAQPAHLWELFKQHLCDDLPRFLTRQHFSPLTEEAIFDYGLFLIHSRLQSDDKTMEVVGLPNPIQNWHTLLGTHSSHQLSYDCNKQTNRLNDSLPKLNDEQRTVFDSILQSALNHTPKTFFLQGAVGAGKTFVYNTICFTLHSHWKNVMCVASSGIAALLLPGGRTAHSTLKIPIDINQCSTCSISKQSGLADALRNVELLIWDECSMQHRHAFEAVNRTLQDLCDCQNLFGGITTILGGDFLQTLPVVTYGSKSDIINAALLSSLLWPSIIPNFHMLEKNMHVGHNSDEQHFAEWLRKVANGTLNDVDDNIIIPNSFLCPYNDVSTLIDHTYPNIGSPHNMQYFHERCILAPHNCEANEINDFILDKFPGQVHDLWAIDKAINPDTEMAMEESYPSEVLHSANPSGFPQAHLKLKIGCPIIVLRNVHSEEGICNGTRGIVMQISTQIIEILLHDGETYMLPRVKLISSDGQLPFHLHRHQFPIALSFAITINKSQGQSFSTVGIDLQVPAFGHGQLYIALSRARSHKTVKCILNDDTTPCTKNVVYREAIL